MKTQNMHSKIDFNALSEQDWLDFLDQGGVLADTVDLSKEQLEAIYTLAYNLYSAGSYSQALKVFQLLCNLNHYEARFYLGLGATRQALKQFELAGETYGFAAMLYPEDPRFPFHAAQCHLNLNNVKAAGSGFEEASRRCGNASEHAAIKTESDKQIESLQACLANTQSQQISED
ncbi:MAG: SycD/LcrH family type III secretion system chaperone [Alteromonadaceae bacterium]|nr:SycD/LcrH family type III secretion system chaperone [Alteromonadaceae bacterium]